jgi:MOSC domain-containing protein YiiM
MAGVIERIHLTPTQDGKPTPFDAVEAVAESGLRGDRYFDNDAGCGLTLIAAEALAAVERDYGIDVAPGAHRRNVTTRGVPVNHLVGERFEVGGARCFGLELCEPCEPLARRLGHDGLREALVHRGGLRCRIEASGQIRVGDSAGERLPAQNDG